MTFIEGYILFAVTTALYSVLCVFWPAIKLAKAEGVENEITQSSLAMLVSLVIIFIANVIIAPLIFYACLFKEPDLRSGFDSSLRSK